ncbi:MAG TPA: A/G-specific adenine glycosylase, partial [bacterium]|nr:A/G-specific adenine glycosylase [bacterium]
MNPFLPDPARSPGSSLSVVMPVPSPRRADYESRILHWFDANRRVMPWRGTRDPYRIWVSEIMLQQTRVATAVEYFNRFIRSFPTVRDLAAAESHDVMKVWEGLGYYARARNLHRAAKEIVQRFGGCIPDRAEDLLSLPGIGRYTTGAILSIAFGRPAPVLDGNVIRVLSRFFQITDNVDRSATQKRLWALAESLLPRTRIRDFNEAMMELGALVCTPKRPGCDSCPLSDLCTARRIGIQASLPVKTPKKPLPHLDVTAGVIWKEGRFLITLRPPRGLLGGLWEFPGGKREAGETLEACLSREIHEELGIEVSVGRRLISVEHAYTHFRITLHVFECRFVSGEIVLHDADD